MAFCIPVRIAWYLNSSLCNLIFEDKLKCSIRVNMTICVCCFHWLFTEPTDSTDHWPIQWSTFVQQIAGGKAGKSCVWRRQSNICILFILSLISSLFLFLTFLHSHMFFVYEYICIYTLVLALPIHWFCWKSNKQIAFECLGVWVRMNNTVLRSLLVWSTWWACVHQRQHFRVKGIDGTKGTTNLWLLTYVPFYPSTLWNFMDAIGF